MGRFDPIGVNMQRLAEDSRDLTKHSLALRRIPSTDLVYVLPLPESPGAGDVLLARLEKIGKNTRIELADGRMANLYEGDLTAVVLGNRYAAEQFEGYAQVWGDACDLLSMSGLCGIMKSRHTGVAEPSRLRILGSLGNADGKRLRQSAYALPLRPFSCGQQF